MLFLLAEMFKWASIPRYDIPALGYRIMFVLMLMHYNNSEVKFAMLGTYNFAREPQHCDAKLLWQVV